MTDYFSKVTNTGVSKIVTAQANSETVAWVEIAVGDGGGSATTPTTTQTALVNEVYRRAVNSVVQDPNDASQIIVEMIIPEDDGGFTIREAGVFDDDGDLVAVCNYPETYKPVLEDGTSRQEIIQIIVKLANTEPVELIIDPSVVVATREWVTNNFTQTITTLHLASDLTGSVTLDETTVTLNAVLVAANVLTKLKTVDGSGSGLDADLLDGFHAASDRNPQTIPVRNSTGGITADLIGNADTATNADRAAKWTNGRTLSLTGGASGNVFIDGTENVSLAVNLIATEILDKLKTVDGATSGIDADLLDGFHAASANTPQTIPVRNGFGKITADLNGTADNATDAVRATKWTNGRTLSLTGGATGNVFLDGTENVSLAVNLIATEILDKLKTVDGSGSGLDADSLDGYNTSLTATPSTVALRNSTGKILADLEGNADTATSATSATTATKWATARNLSLTGGATGSVSIDGSANASLSVALVATEILDKLKTVDGSGSGLDADSLDGYNTSLTATPSTVALRNSTGKILADLEGNADTATSATSATTATKWATARSVSLTGAITGSASGVDGSGNVSLATAFASGTFTGFLSTNGYQKFPSGIIMQMGRVASGTSGILNVTFPIAFPTAIQTIILCPRDTTGNPVSNDDQPYISDDSLSGFTLKWAFASGTITTRWPHVLWFAVGY